MPKIYIAFNKETRKVTCLAGDMETFKFMKDPLIKEIEIEDNVFNIARFRWEGDYDTGQLIDLFKEKRAIVTEKEVDEKYYGLFFRKYTIEEILFNLIKYSDFRKTLEVVDDGRECYTRNNEAGYMQRFLDVLMKKKEKEIEMYKSSPNHIYETRNDQAERIKDSFKTNKVD